jgi:hypothetical protein
MVRLQVNQGTRPFTQCARAVTCGWAFSSHTCNCTNTGRLFGCQLSWRCSSPTSFKSPLDTVQLLDQIQGDIGMPRLTFRQAQRQQSAAKEVDTG